MSELWHDALYLLAMFVGTIVLALLWALWCYAVEVIKRRQW